jgi:lipopolysaccharide export system protein LptA
MAVLLSPVGSPKERTLAPDLPALTTLLILLGALVFLLPAPLEAQVQGSCDVPHFDKLSVLTLSNGSRITYFNGPVIRCRGGTRIQADSAVVFEATNYTQLFRNVVFSDETSRLTAREARYFDTERRLKAWGEAVLRDLEDGSVIRGDTMVLLGSTPQRPDDQLTVTGERPRATLYPALQPLPPDSSEARGTEGAQVQLPDTAGAGAAGQPPDSASTAADTTGPEPPVQAPDSVAAVADSVAPAREVRPTPPPEPEERTPYEIDARRIFLEGSRYFRATGQVNITRDSLQARADSVEYDESVGSLFLARRARVHTASYDLTGETIRLDIPRDEVREVLARDEAVLEGEDLTLLAPMIRLFLTQGALERLVAVDETDSLAVGDTAAAQISAFPGEFLAGGQPHPVALAMGLESFPSRPYVSAQDFLLWADSVEVLAPGETLDRLRAVGRARGETLARDSLNTPDTPALIRRDWLEGDTIVAIFTRVPDSARASDSLQALPADQPADSLPATPAVATDSAETEYRLERLIAKAQARSLYRLTPSDSTLVEEKRMAVHYVTADQITILMEEGEVQEMEVQGSTTGIHLEPLPAAETPPDTTGAGAGSPADSTRVLPDSIRTPPDTTAVPPDTTMVPPDTTGVPPATTRVSPGAGDPPTGKRGVDRGSPGREGR